MCVCDGCEIWCEDRVVNLTHSLSHTHKQDLACLTFFCMQAQIDSRASNAHSIHRRMRVKLRKRGGTVEYIV